jgi:hypothetical protein
MAEKFTTKDNKTILYEKGIATVVDVKELEAQKAEIEEKVKVISDDKELLAWAKINYPMQDHTADLSELAKISEKLDLIKEE